jgi:hypothetical protein
VLTDGGKGRIVLDPAQHVRYTGGVHKIAPYGPGSGVRQHRRGHLFIYLSILPHWPCFIKK